MTMHHKAKLGTVGSIAAAAMGGALLLFAPGCQQLGMSCTTARGSWVVTFHLKGPDTGECAHNPGGVFGTNTYNYPNAQGNPDFDHASMAIQSEVLGTLVSDAEGRLGDTPDPTHKEYAAGDFSTGKPDGNAICTVPTLTVASKDIPVLPAVVDDPTTPDDDESLPEVPATSIAYAWSNLRFVVKESFPGTLFVGDLTYTQDGCTAEYEAWGLFGVSGFTGVPTSCDNGEGQPDDSLCDVKKNPDAAYLNTDLNIGCDPGLLLCTIKDRPPVD